jgi:DNA-binding GntR family transcriptional regulator
MSSGDGAVAHDRLNSAGAVDQVYAAVRERITNGSLPRGGRVHQEEEALELGVSRTPVREALRRLAAEGLVEMRTNRGARVADVRLGRGARRLARLVVEPGAERLAAQHRPAEPLARAASGNDFLIQLVERLWVARIGATIYERQVETQERMLLDVREHELILEAIEAGDGRRAESLTRRHLSDAMKRSLDILGD